MNYSYYAVPAAWVLAFVPHAYAAALTFASREMDNFANVSPRESLNKVRSQEKQTALTAKYLRAEAASQNGFENLPLLIGAVIAGNVAGIPAEELNTVAGLYLASRVVYNLLYITTTTELFSYARSASYISGVGLCFSVFLKAANVANKAFL